MFDKKDWTRKRAASNSEFVRKLKDNQSCTDCGNKYPYYVMDFDHRPGTEKRQLVSLMATQAWSMEALIAEIEKCDLVCANCHRIRTHSRRLPR